MRSCCWRTRARREPRAWLLAHDDAALDDAAGRALSRRLVARRAAGEPLAYLVGEKEFHGLDAAGRRRTCWCRGRTPRRWSTGRSSCCARAAGAAPRVVDLGTGSGAIALAVKHALPDAHGDARSTRARRRWPSRARNAAAPRRWRSSSLRGDWWSAVGGPALRPGRCATRRTSPPTTRTSLRCGTSRALALTPGADGLDAIRAHRRAAPRAPASPAAGCCSSTATTRPPRCTRLLRDAGFADVATRARPGRPAALHRRPPRAERAALAHCRSRLSVARHDAAARSRLRTTHRRPA